MNFEFTEEQVAISHMAKEFARDELAPHASYWDAEGIFPREVLQKAAALGFAGIYTREDIGGTGLSRLDAAIVFEELSTACIGTVAYLSIHNMVTWMIDRFGEDSLRRYWGPRLTSMQAFASYCLTEPDSGSDAASLKTTARLEGDYYVINGSKSFISGGGSSDVYAVMVRTGDESHHGISCVLIEKDTPGLKFGKQEEKLGWNNVPTAMLFFENCRVPRSNLVGEEGHGFKIALSGLNGGRINIAACSLGGAKACLQLAKHYMHERKQFKARLDSFQALQFKFANMLTQYHSARLMVHRAAAALDHKHHDAPLFCAMAKGYATDAGFNICNEALQLHGGYGYLKEFQVERYVRDLRVHQILEGTNEIMQNIIAKTALKADYII